MSHNFSYATLAVESLAHEAHGRGVPVLRGHCYDFGTTPPYGPWVEIASAYRREGSLPPFPQGLRDDQQLSDVRDDERSAGGQESLFAAIHDFIATVTHTRPLAPLLEDMHWSDTPSFDLLCWLGAS